MSWPAGPLTDSRVPAGRLLLAAGALVAGAAVGCAASGRITVIAVLAVLIAAANGYSKAHSP